MIETKDVKFYQLLVFWKDIISITCLQIGLAGLIYLFPKKRKNYRIFVKNGDDDVSKNLQAYWIFFLYFLKLHKVLSISSKFQVYSILQSEIK